MPKKSTNYVSISLNDDVLKVAEVKSGLQPKVTKVVVQSVKGLGSTELSKTIGAVLKGFKPKSSDVVFVVSPSVTTTKNIEVPSTDSEEIHSIVNLQAGRHTPFSRDEIQLGYVNLGIHKPNYTKVLLVIANRTVLKNQLRLIEQSGVLIKKVLFAPEGMARFYADHGGIAGESKPTGIIDIDSVSTNFVVVLNGLPITSRSIPIGYNHLRSEGQIARSNLITELKKTLEGYQNDDIGPALGRFILTGSDDISSGLQSALQQDLGLGVTVAGYVDLLKPAKNVFTRISDHSLLDVIAPATVADEVQVNLIPDEVKIQKSVEDQGREVFAAAVLVILILVFVGAALGTKVYFKNAFLNRIKNNYQKEHTEVDHLKQTQQKVQIVKNFMIKRMASLDLMSELYTHIPNAVYLTSVTLENDGVINIQGVSDTGSTVYSLGSDLEASDIFYSAEIKSTTAKKDRGKDATAFEIAIKLESPEEEALQEEPKK